MNACHVVSYAHHDPCCNASLDLRDFIIMGTSCRFFFAPRLNYVKLTIWALSPALLMDGLKHINFWLSHIFDCLCHGSADFSKGERLLSLTILAMHPLSGLPTLAAKMCDQEMQSLFADAGTSGSLAVQCSEPCQYEHEQTLPEWPLVRFSFC